LPTGVTFEDESEREAFRELVMSTALVDFQYPNMELKALQRLTGTATAVKGARVTLDADAMRARLAPKVSENPTATPIE
jgi:hypothetical protein